MNFGDFGTNRKTFILFEDCSCSEKVLGLRIYESNHPLAEKQDDINNSDDKFVMSYN